MFRMIITYNFYSAYGHLPEPTWLFDVTRRIDFMMQESPYRNWKKIEKWARPMGQLKAGCFLNITDSSQDEIEKAIDMDGKKTENTKLEMVWIDRGYVRIQFKVEGKCFKLKVTSINTHIQTQCHIE